MSIRLIICYLFLSVLLAACSGDNEAENMALGHSHPEATDMEKHLFEHEFAQQCIVQKTSLSNSKDAERFVEPLCALRNTC